MSERPRTLDISSPGWHENLCYPGTHWLFHDQRRNYVARVDYAKWMEGRYMWRVMHFSMTRDDEVGFEPTLEAAQRAAENVLNGKPHQLNFGI